MGEYCNLAFHNDFVKAVACIEFVDERKLMWKYNVCEKCYHSLMNKIAQFNFTFKVKWMPNPIWSVS